MGDYELMIDEYLNLLEEDPSAITRVQGRLQNVLARDNENQISDMLQKSIAPEEPGRS